jgi:hypothetical protein
MRVVPLSAQIGVLSDNGLRLRVFLEIRCSIQLSYGSNLFATNVW